MKLLVESYWYIIDSLLQLIGSVKSQNNYFPGLEIFFWNSSCLISDSTGTIRFRYSSLVAWLYEFKRISIFFIEFSTILGATLFLVINSFVVSYFQQPAKTHV